MYLQYCIINDMLEDKSKVWGGQAQKILTTAVENELLRTIKMLLKEDYIYGNSWSKEES